MAEIPGTAAAAMTELAARAHNAEREAREHMEELRMLGLAHTIATAPPPMVEGRVFQRLYRYHLLPVQLQLLSDAVAMHLVTPEVRSRVFGAGRWRHPHAVGPVVRGQKLVDTIKQYLLDTQDGVSDVVDSARQIAEALVLSGFISPVHDPDDEDNIVTYVHAREFYELVAPGAQQLTAAAATTAASELAHAHSVADEKKSVWGVTDGATRAGFVFRKPDAADVHGWRSLLAKVSLCGAGGGRRETKRYAVINKTHHALFVFPNDCARQELNHVPLRDALVQYEAGAARAPLHRALKVWTDTRFEILDFVVRHRQEDWLLSLLDAGAKYKEANPAHATWADAHASFYSLMDVDAAGRTFYFEDLLGKVVLLVNVASKDSEAPLQYPELAALAAKYADDGLAILAFPSGQFGGDGQEFATDTEIVQYVTQAYDVQFPIFAKRDVNGLDARPAFLYLNAHLPGRFGAFTEWNFTKFLVGRNGRPHKRYVTRELPIAAIEHDIRMLLGSTSPLKDDSERQIPEETGTASPRPSASERD